MPFNVIIATPSLGICRSTYAHSLARLVSFFAQYKVFPENEVQMLDVTMVEGSGVGAGRELLVDRFLKNEVATHLLFIDEDMGFYPDVLHIMARRRQPIVSCNYRSRVPPAWFTAVKLNHKEGRMPTTKESSGLEPAFYTGFGMCLLERKVLEAVGKPRFLGGYNQKLDTYSTEDFPFFEKAREKGFICYVDHDASKRVWHHGMLNYSWEDDHTNLMLAFRDKKEEEIKNG